MDITGDYFLVFSEIRRSGVSIALAVLMVLPIGTASGQTPRMTEGSQVSLERIREHKNATVKAVSPDGQSMILWETDTPIQTVRIPSGNQDSRPTAGDSKLLWVEVETGRELASIPVGFRPRVRFFPRGERVVVQHSGDFADFQTITWNLAVGRVTTCLEGEIALQIRNAEPISEVRMVAQQRGYKNPHELVLLDELCSVVDSSPADPDNPEDWFATEELQVSPDDRVVAYLVRSPPGGADRLLLRDVSDLRVLHRIQAPVDRWGYEEFTFTEDSRQVVAHMWKDAAVRLTLRRFPVYDTDTGRLLRELQIRIDYLISMAVSPDALLFAAGQRKESDSIRSMRAQDSVVLYDFEKGHELARIEFPEVADWFVDGVHNIAFADNQYLITSNRHTQVWKINRPDSR